MNLAAMPAAPPGAAPAQLIRFPAFRGYAYMPFKLKGVLVRYGVAQTELAAAVMQRGGRALSATSMTQIVNHRYFPRSTPEADIRAQIESYLAAHGVPAAEIASVWESDEGTDSYRAAHPVGHHPNIRPRKGDSHEDTEMFFRAEPLRPETRKAFGLFRNPFSPDFRSTEDIFMWPDYRYCREALWDAAVNGAFRAIVSESGGGKTTLLQELRERVGAAREAGRESIVLIEPYVVGMEETDSAGTPLKSSAIQEAVIRALDPYARLPLSNQSRYRLAHALLTESARAGNSHLLLIEEAHALPQATLKQLKRWIEMRDGLRALLGIVLVGQYELRARLSPSNPAVREVVQRCELVPLTPLDEHLEAYIKHRFGRVGADADQAFESEAFAALRDKLTHRAGERVVSMCYPLAINNLAIRALNAACARRASRVDAAIVKGC